MAKRTSLDKALETVEAEQRAGQTIDEEMAQLRVHAPDIADTVDEERLNITEAYASFTERKAAAAKAEANKCENLLRLSETAWQVGVCAGHA